MKLDFNADFKFDENETWDSFKEIVGWNDTEKVEMPIEFATIILSEIVYVTGRKLRETLPEAFIPFFEVLKAKNILSEQMTLEWFDLPPNV